MDLSIADASRLVNEVATVIETALDERDPRKVVLRLEKRLARREAAFALAKPGTARHRDAAMDVAGLRVLVAHWRAVLDAQS